MTVTFKHANAADEHLVMGSDGNEYSVYKLEVIDLKTGKNPRDEQDRLLMFLEVDTVAGFGIVYDNDRGWNDTKQIMGDFELRLYGESK